MKEYYEIKNDKVISYDTNYGKEVTKYQDNIEEIFKTENILEGLTDSRDVIISKEDEYKKSMSDCKDSTKGLLKELLKIFIMTLITVILTSLPMNVEIINSLFNIIKYSSIGLASFATLLTASGILICKVCYNNSKKMYISTYNERIYTEEQIKSLQKQLEELKKDNKVTINNDIDKSEKKTVDYKEELETYKSLQRLTFLIKYFEKKYEKYYKKGILKEKILEEYKDEGTAELVNNYFDIKKLVLKNKDN